MTFYITSFPLNQSGCVSGCRKKNDDFILFAIETSLCSLHPCPRHLLVPASVNRQQSGARGSHQSPARTRGSPDPPCLLSTACWEDGGEQAGLSHHQNQWSAPKSSTGGQESRIIEFLPSCTCRAQALQKGAKGAVMRESLISHLLVIL